MNNMRSIEGVSAMIKLASQSMQLLFHILCSSQGLFFRKSLPVTSVTKLNNNNILKYYVTFSVIKVSLIALLLFKKPSQ